VKAESKHFETLKRAIDLANFAPSVHNTQPWEIRVKNNTVTINIDKNYQLEYGDPTGRQTIISLGIFFQALTITTRSFGLYCSSYTFNGTELEVHVKMLGQTNNYEAIINNLKTRVTDRSVYKPVAIDKKFVSKVTHNDPDLKTRVWFSDERKVIEKVADLTSKGIGLALVKKKTWYIYLKSLYPKNHFLF
jgi:hypothetical protein